MREDMTGIEKKDMGRRKDRLENKGQPATDMKKGLAELK